ncbi:MAG: hypothetical protein MJ125_06465 [Clostridia bacterium]|nr:hypothetical protein [Clostridia bacterium]
MKNNKAEFNDNMLEAVTGGVKSPFIGNFDGNEKVANLRISSGNENPDEEYSPDAVPTAADIISELKS